MTNRVRGLAGKVIGCDLLKDGVVITFSDDQSFIFDPRFLYEHREHATWLTTGEDDDSPLASPA